MKLFDYKPIEYVDVNPNLPLEFMQTQVTNSQNKYDSQVKAINETADNFMKLNPGLYTREEYDRIKNKYTSQIENLTKELSTYGDVGSIVPQYSKLVSDIAFDPSIKALNQDYLAYQQHLKFMAENPGAIDLSGEGPQYSPTQALELNRYRGVKPEDSIKEIKDTILKDFKPYKDVNTDKWNIRDPRDGSIISGNTEQEVTYLAKERISKAFEDYYPAWAANAAGKSEYDMRRLSNNNLSVYQDEVKGRELYNKLWKPYEQAAYTQTSQEQQNVSGGATTTKSPTTPNPQPPKVESDQTTTEEYGYRQFGKVHNTEDNITGVSTSALDIHNLQTSKDKLYRQASILKGKGDIAGSNELIKQWHNLDAKQKLAVSWKQGVEKELYGKDFTKDNIEAEIKTFGNMPGFPEVTKDNYGVDYIYVRKGNKYYLKHLKGYSDLFTTIPAGYEQEIGDITEKNEANGISLEDTLVANSGPELKELHARWDKYLNYKTSGHSYIVGEDARKAADVLAFSLITTGKKPKNPITDEEIDDFEEYTEQMQTHKATDTGAYRLSDFSYEILMDEKDGPVLIIAGINPGGDNNIVEYQLEDTPDVSTLLGMLAPKEKGINTSFIEATQNMKKGDNKTGSFNIGRTNGKVDEYKFTKMPVGNGLFMYKDDKGELYDNLHALISDKHLNAAVEDANHVAAAQMLSARIDQARQMKDPVAIKAAVDAYQIYMDRHKGTEANTNSSGKQQPQTQSNSLGW